MMYVGLYEHESTGGTRYIDKAEGMGWAATRRHPNATTACLTDGPDMSKYWLCAPRNP